MYVYTCIYMYLSTCTRDTLQSEGWPHPPKNDMKIRTHAVLLVRRVWWQHSFKTLICLIQTCDITRSYIDIEFAYATWKFVDVGHHEFECDDMTPPESWRGSITCANMTCSYIDVEFARMRFDRTVMPNGNKNQTKKTRHALNARHLVSGGVCLL